MYKLVEHPFNGKFYKSKVVIRGDSYSDMINLAVSIAYDIRKAGKLVGIEITGQNNITDLLGWVNDELPTTIVYIDKSATIDPIDSTMIAIHTASNPVILPDSLVGENGVAIGMVLPLKTATKQTKLDATDQTLLLRLETLLPSDDPVRIFRDKIRSGEL